MRESLVNPDENSARMTALSVLNEQNRGRNAWTDYDSDLSSYEASFFGVMPMAERNKGGLKDYVENFLAERKGKAVGIDLGGPGSNLFRGFPPGFFEKTIGVTLTDLRGEEDKRIDTSRNHILMTGDIASIKTQQECKELLAGQKADVVFERMMGGTYNLPMDNENLAKILGMWYRLLNDKALLFAQYHPSWTYGVEELGQNIMRRFPKEMEFQMNGHFFRIMKLPGAPEKLPLPERKAN